MWCCGGRVALIRLIVAKIETIYSYNLCIYLYILNIFLRSRVDGPDGATTKNNNNNRNCNQPAAPNDALPLAAIQTAAAANPFLILCSTTHTKASA